MKKLPPKEEIKSLPDYLEKVAVGDRPIPVNYPLRAANIIRDDKELELLIIEEVKNDGFSKRSKGGAELHLRLCSDIENKEYPKKPGSSVKKGRRISMYIDKSFKISVKRYIEIYL